MSYKYPPIVNCRSLRASARHFGSDAHLMMAKCRYRRQAIDIVRVCQASCYNASMVRREPREELKILTTTIGWATSEANIIIKCASEPNCVPSPSHTQAKRRDAVARRSRAPANRRSPWDRLGRPLRLLAFHWKRAKTRTQPAGRRAKSFAACRRLRRAKL